MSATKTPAAAPAEHIATRILKISTQRVIVDADLAALCGMPTKALNQPDKRNSNRFRDNFVSGSLPRRGRSWSQAVTTSRGSNS